MLVATVFWYEALMLGHVYIVATDHHLSCVGAPPNWTNIRLLNMIIRVKVWIYLNMVIIATGHRRLKLIEDRSGLALHVAVERAL